MDLQERLYPAISVSVAMPTNAGLTYSDPRLRLKLSRIKRVDKFQHPRRIENSLFQKLSLALSFGLFLF